jgi:hypothetical protein
MSALPLNPDILSVEIDVRYVPLADMSTDQLVRPSSCQTRTLQADRVSLPHA